MKHLLILCIALFFSCENSNNGFQKKGDDFYFKLLRFGEDTTKVEAGKLVQFSWEVENEQKKSIYKDRLFIKIDSVFPSGGLLQSLCLLKQGETGAFKFPSEKLEPELLTKLQLDSINGKSITHFISIDNVLTEEEFIHQKKHFLDWVNNSEPVNYNSIEQQIIDNYIQNKDLELDRSETGLRFKVFKTNSGIKTGYGKHVKISYTGGVLNQEKTHITTIQDFYIGEEMQVIKAIEEAILYLEQGDSCFIIAPPNLAFGEKGSSTGLIPPASPVCYSIKLLSCE